MTSVQIIGSNHVGIIGTDNDNKSLLTHDYSGTYLSYGELDPTGQYWGLEEYRLYGLGRDDILYEAITERNYIHI